ncbi:MAG: hypothetical protein HOV80_07165 [Polyangiaceae bacterium]|nr:hypothetical protein [Polyangiaceae bacterium]
MSKTSLVHEAPLDVMRERPAVVLDVLVAAGVSLPTNAERLEVAVAESNLTEASPVHWSADLVTVIAEPGGPPKLVVVVEVRRERDPTKQFVWPQYVAALAARHCVPVVLVVWAFDAATATWARGPHEVGPGFALTPVVIEPASLPIIRSVDQAAEHLDFAVLVALTRLGEAASRRGESLSQAAADEILHVAGAAMAIDDAARRRRLGSLLHGTAREPFRATLKQFLEANDMGALELIREEGRQEAKATTLIRQLRRRGFVVDDATEARILGTADLGQLDTWLDRVLTASSLEEVLEA